ncbi:type II secretion system F family protein [Singulisphaera rosea]
MPEATGELPALPRLSFNDLIALNDEIAALAGAGLPLERGLQDLGGELSGSLGQSMRRLSERIGQGQSLLEALQEEGDQFPPLYRAVVAAGSRSGRLPTALESLAEFIRSYRDARHSIGQALWYPLIVLVMAYGLFLLLVTQWVPHLTAAFDSLQVPRSFALDAFTNLGATARYWGPILPAILLALAASWAWTGRAANVLPGGRGSPLLWIPWMRSMTGRFEAANFADLLAMLIEHGVPMPEAIILASESSGDPAITGAGRSLADSIERGDARNDEVYRSSAFTPMLRWTLATCRESSNLPVVLRQLSNNDRKRARDDAEKIKLFFPVMAMVAVGSTAVLAYGLTLFLPITTLFHQLATP